MLKGELLELLQSVRLDVSFEKAQGDYLWHTKNEVQEKVLDMVGGFGTTLLGHNNPELKKVIFDFLEADKPIHTQGSVKVISRQLACRLSELAGQPEQYRCILTNSGAETVEAAIKHAELFRKSRVPKPLDKMTDPPQER